MGLKPLYGRDAHTTTKLGQNIQIIHFPSAIIQPGDEHSLLKSLSACTRQHGEQDAATPLNVWDA